VLRLGQGSLFERHRAGFCLAEPKRLGASANPFSRKEVGHDGRRVEVAKWRDIRYGDVGGARFTAFAHRQSHEAFDQYLEKINPALRHRYDEHHQVRNIEMTLERPLRHHVLIPEQLRDDGIFGNRRAEAVFCVAVGLQDVEALGRTVVNSEQGIGNEGLGEVPIILLAVVFEPPLYRRRNVKGLLPLVDDLSGSDVAVAGASRPDLN